MGSIGGRQVNLQSLRVAVGLLTRFPVPRTDTPKAELGGSLAWFPLVGTGVALFVGALLHLSGRIFSDVALAALGVAAWTAVTGALHLDGVADTADGWSAGHADPQRGLEVMHDSRIGAHGAVALALVLLLKFAALVQLLTQDPPWYVGGAALLMSCAAARGWVALSLSRAPTAASSSLATSFKTGKAKRAGAAAAALVCCMAAAVAWAMPELYGYVVLQLCSSGALVWYVTLRARQRFGGLTGDVCGAMIEACEVLGLFVWGMRV